MPRLSFARIAQDLLSRHQATSLYDRWKEAISFGEGAKATHFYVHEATDVVNIIWLNGDGIRDITFLPKNEEEPEPAQAMFNFVPLTSIVTLEVREAPNIAQLLIGVDGDIIVQVIVPSSPIGQLYWVALGQQETAELKRFLTAVLSAMVAKH